MSKKLLGRRVFVLSAPIVATLCLFAYSHAAAADALPSKVAARMPPAPTERSGSAKSTLRFEPNVGQFDPQLSYLARGPGYLLSLVNGAAVLNLRADARGGNAKHVPSEPLATAGVVAMRVAGAVAVEPQALEKLPGVTNYFVGADRSKWRTGVAGYGRVRYDNVLPGVSIDYYGANGRQFEYDLRFAPHARVDSAELTFDGVQSIDIDADGGAILTLVGGGTLRQTPPVAYQISDSGGRRLIPVRYEQRDHHSLGFVVGAYDAAQPLVVDPRVGYSTYLGGSGADAGGAIALDSAGRALVVGATASTDFPLASGFAGGGDVFVSEIDADGASLVYSTYLGGGGADFGLGIAVDATGNAFVVGRTSSTNFPLAQPLQATRRGPTDAFLTSLTTSGVIRFSSYLGGTGNEEALSVAVDNAGGVYIAGTTDSSNFPTLGALQTVYGGGAQDGFVTKLNANATLAFSTYLGGGGADAVLGIAVDSSRNAYLTGTTSSGAVPRFPTVAPSRAYGGGASDGFVAKLNLSGSGLIYSSFLGGAQADGGRSIAVDATGSAVVVGSTTSADFPTASPWQAALGGDSDAFVTKVKPDGSALTFSTFLGGEGSDVAAGLGIDRNDNIYVAGVTRSLSFPTFSATQPALNGVSDAFVTKIDGLGVVGYSSYLGGSLAESVGTEDSELSGSALAVDSRGTAYVVGTTSSTDFPTSSPLQAANAGGADAFIAKISPDPTSTPAGDLRSLAALAGLLALTGALFVSHHGRSKLAAALTGRGPTSVI